MELTMSEVYKGWKKATADYEKAYELELLCWEHYAPEDAWEYKLKQLKYQREIDYHNALFKLDDIFLEIEEKYKN